jgi:CRISPR/Cas system-associated exonuclease Cas4 (RecB family)
MKRTAGLPSLPILEPSLSGIPQLRLSKSRFVAGSQCHKLLWLKVHEPGAVELQPTRVLEDRFDQGRLVGELARGRFPGGVLIDLPHDAVKERVAATQAAILTGAPAIFEASFVADDTFVAVDVLERVPGGWRLIEVKSSSSQKEEHVADAAIQLYVLRRSGIAVVAVEIMHLNKEHRCPDTGDLFCRTDVTADAESALGAIPEEIRRQMAMLVSDMPKVTIGLHCSEPWECPFHDRCWPDDRDHIANLYFMGKKAYGFMAKGVHSLHDLPADHKCPAAAKRQLRSIRENRIIVEPGLEQALADFDCRLGFLDFETVARAVPVWPGLAPWGQSAAQFSYHARRDDGTYAHAEWLAEGPVDCRPMIAQMLVEATAAEERIVTYSGFEKTRIRDLQKAVPALKPELEALEARLIDLLPVLRDYVYHPDFRGSFSLKAVLNPLVPELSYTDLVIVDGQTASVEIARLLFVAQKIPPEERDRIRDDLLAYCKQDTWAMVMLLDRLRRLAGGETAILRLV